MLKYSDIITKLTDKQKIRILTDLANISENEYKTMGIPFVKIANIKDYCRDRYPHTSSLAHSWNPSLWQSVASDKVACLVEDDVRFAVAPGAKIKLSPYRKEFTEDPYIAAIMSGAYIKAATDAGVVVGAAGNYITRSDEAWLDTLPDYRTINEYLVQPYANAASIGGSNITLTDMRAESEEYRKLGYELQTKDIENAEFVICGNASDKNTVDFITRGIICLSASSDALETAVLRYRKLKQLLEAGKDVTVTQLNEALEKRVAISDESINTALDRTLEFLFKCSSSHPVATKSIEAADDISFRATLESTVLLKNKDNLLPLNKMQKISIIGGIEFSNDENCLLNECKGYFSAYGYNNVSIAQGYDVADYYRQDLIEEAVSLCKESDVTVLLLGFGYDEEKRIPVTEKMTLPANQLYLADRLAKTGKKVVALLMTGHAPDIDFTRQFDSALVTPVRVRDSANVIVQILSGIYNPDGHLAYTFYAGTENSFKKREVYKDAFNMKAGPFIGYRYYDTADMRIGYPFGHGLSYTKFAYSNLKIENTNISFTVKNVGAIRGAEVVQVYAGAKESAILRPKKELCGFAKIELGPGEKKRVAINIELPRVYSNGDFVTEKGVYNIFVGSSVSDIRLTGKYCSEGISLESDGEKISRYLQTETNILDDDYTLEAKYNSMKKTVKNILFGVGSLALSISLAVFNATTAAKSLFLGIVAGILAVCAIVFFIIEAIERSAAHADQRKKINKENQEYFEGAEQIPVLSTDKMFRDEFDNVREESIATNEQFASDDEFDHASYIDDNFTIKAAVEQFSKFAFERGYKMGRGVVENLFASLLSSKLLIVNGLSKEEFNSFTVLLSEYFDSLVCINDASKNAQDSKSVFFEYDAQGELVQKNIFSALQFASDYIEKIQFLALDGINDENINNWLTPFMKYIRSTKKRNEIAVFDENGKKYSYVIGQNIWLMINIESGKSIDTLPIAVARSASVVKINYNSCNVQEERMDSHGFNAYQVDYMLSKEVNAKDVSENVWKKIDKLEKYVNDHTEFSIGNKLWIDLEKHIGILLACDFETPEAVDTSISSRLLASVMISLNGKLNKEDRTVLQTMEYIFGEENVEHSKAFIDSVNVIQRNKTVEKTTAETTDTTVTDKTE